MRLRAPLPANGEPEDSRHAALSPYLFDAGGLPDPHLVVREESTPINGMGRLIVGSLVDIYGYGVQVSAALSRWRQWLDKLTSSGRTSADNEMWFGEADPHDPNATYVYRRTFGYLLDASSPDGNTLVIHRRNLIVLLDASWEDRYRSRIVEEAGIKNKNDLGSDVFQDVRMYRNSIMHAHGTLRDKPKVFHFFDQGDEVTLTSDHVGTIFRTAIDELNRIAKEHFGTNPRFSFEEPLYSQYA